MSLESNIATLTAEVVQAKDQLTGILPQLIQAKNDAMNVAVNMYRTFYVDEINGSDSNSGNDLEHALSTIQHAINLTPVKAKVKIKIIGNFNLDQDLEINYKDVLILGNDYNHSSKSSPFSFVFHSDKNVILLDGSSFRIGLINVDFRLGTTVNAHWNTSIKTYNVQNINISIGYGYGNWIDCVIENKVLNVEASSNVNLQLSFLKVTSLNGQTCSFSQSSNSTGTIQVVALNTTDASVILPTTEDSI